MARVNPEQCDTAAAADEQRVKITVQVPRRLFARLSRNCTTTRTKQNLLYPAVERTILALPKK